MKYVTWVVLNDGVSERVTADDVDAAEEARVIDQALIPLTLGVPGAVGKRAGPYAVTGEISGKRALVRLWDEGAPLADVGVCLHSRAAPGLWAALRAGGGDALSDVDMPAAAPWCAVRCYAPEFVLPPWFDVWTKTVGMALVRREGW